MAKTDLNIPLHIAVLHSDRDLVRRQCLALRARHESVDKPAGGMVSLKVQYIKNG
ncbi:hypothetical protein MSG28_015347 [Choristoneura fumiferana]|uniref:Uncharacterized protein n=1 Tax=Choristoneura fumiferana TaxID=7141 RepID=A0ACC0KA01_CHOFU|nr:hypothetical protein MSG28_015347 [Choristoneura fumiferana]